MIGDVPANDGAEAERLVQQPHLGGRGVRERDGPLPGVNLGNGIEQDADVVVVRLCVWSDRCAPSRFARKKNPPNPFEAPNARCAGTPRPYPGPSGR